MNPWIHSPVLGTSSRRRSNADEAKRGNPIVASDFSSSSSKSFAGDRKVGTSDGSATCRDFEQQLRLARDGNPIARGRVLQQFWLALLHDARREMPYDLRSKGGGSDLVQETMLDAHRDFAQFTGRTEREFFTWLQCLLRHNFSNFARAYRTHAKRDIKRETTLSVESEEPVYDRRRPVVASADERVVDRESRESYRRAIERMPHEIRELMCLRFDQRLTYSDIGGRLGLTAEAARKLLTRTLRLLGKDLDG
jgi:RNA polymerase sigma-70 factor (ECF subfamily)